MILISTIVILIYITISTILISKCTNEEIERQSIILYKKLKNDIDNLKKDLYNDK